jgi:hypothetical protein
VIFELYKFLNDGVEASGGILIYERSIRETLSFYSDRTARYQIFGEKAMYS